MADVDDLIENNPLLQLPTDAQEGLKQWVQAGQPEQIEDAEGNRFSLSDITQLGFTRREAMAIFGIMAASGVTAWQAIQQFVGQARGADTSGVQVGVAGGEVDVTIDELRDTGGDVVFDVDDTGDIVASRGFNFPAVSTLEQPTIDLIAHGATPDDNTDDTPALNSAIQKAADLGGGRIRFPAGQTNIDSDPDFSPLHNDPANGDYSFPPSVSGVGLVGMGEGTSVVKVTSNLGNSGPNTAKADTPGPWLYRDFTLEVQNLDSAILWAGVDSRFENITVRGDANGKALINGRNYNCIWEDIFIDNVTSIGYAGKFDVHHEWTTYRNVVIRGGDKSGWWHNASNHVTHINCEVADSINGIHGENNPTNVRVYGGQYHGNFRRGIGGIVDYVEGAEIYNNNQSGNTPGFAACVADDQRDCDIYDDQSTQTQFVSAGRDVRDCNFEATDIDVNKDGGEMTVSGCTFGPDADAAIRGVQSGFFEDNHMHGGWLLIRSDLNTGTRAKDYRVAGNYFDGGTVGLVLARCDYITVTNNTFKDQSDGFIDLGKGGVSGTNNAVIKGNKMRDPNTTPTYTYVHSGDAATSGVRVRNNDDVPGSTAVFESLAGVSVISGNDAYVTENKGTEGGAVAIDAPGTVTVTVNHGLNVTPDANDIRAVLTNPTQTDYDAHIKHIANIGSTSFDAVVEVVTASATNGATADLSWRVEDYWT